MPFELFLKTAKTREKRDNFQSEAQDLQTGRIPIQNR